MEITRIKEKKSLHTFKDSTNFLMSYLVIVPFDDFLQDIKQVKIRCCLFVNILYWYK